MPSLRGTADEAEHVPPWGFFREGPPPRGPRQFSQSASVRVGLARCARVAAR